MNTSFVDRFRRTLNLETARRLLIRYFMGKIAEDVDPADGFDRLIYPPAIQDLPFAIPQLAGKVEVEPHMRSVNAMEDTAEIGWNLFVLGTHRKYLGETFHTDLRRLASQIQQGTILCNESSSSAGRQATPKEVIAFIIQILGTHGEGYMNLEKNTQIMPIKGVTQPSFGNFGGQGSFYRRSTGTGW